VLRSRGGSLRTAQAAAVRYRPVYPGFAGLRPGADPGMAAGGALCPGARWLRWHGGQPGGGARSVLADRVGASVLQADAGDGRRPHPGAVDRWLVDAGRSLARLFRIPDPVFRRLLDAGVAASPRNAARRSTAKPADRHTGQLRKTA